MTVTSSEITLKLSALEHLAGQSGIEFDDLAALAVSGDAEAGKRASDIDARLTRLSTDRRILSRALERSQAAEATAAAAEAEEARRRHLDVARDHAARLIEVADKVDAAIAVLAEALPEMEVAEIAIKRALGQARIPLRGASFGQSGIALIAADSGGANHGRARQAARPSPFDQ